MLVSSVPLFWAWKMPSGNSWYLVLALGMFGTVGQIFLTRGYTLAPSARISPFTWFSVVFGALFGYLFWGETLSWMFVIGAGFIACSGLMALYGKREH
jgi:drug/metabolite transporter (DMT)-like permease